jgi:FkbM family methyltransferase
MPSFYAQQGEDIYVYNKFINRVTDDGVFVELGGYDGLTYSNSKFFEDTLKFKGVLIEPTNQFHSMVHNRPNCKNHNIAVAHKHQMVMMTGNSAVAGLTDTMHPAFRDRWHKHSSSYLVEAKPFKTILQDSGVDHIDLLTIDVEGGEQAVLETMDFTIPVYVIIIEADGDNHIKDEACRDILRKNGFVFDRHLVLNDIWYNPAYPFIDRVFDPSRKKVEFNSIHDLGDFKYVESSCISQIEDALRA